MDYWWCIGDLELTSEGLVTLNSVIVHVIEDDLWNYLYGKTVTFSYGLADGTTGSFTFTLETTNHGFTKDGINMQCPALGYGFGNTVAIRAEGVTISWVKLELGPVATPFIPPNPVIELSKCQKYYREIFGTYMDYHAFTSDRFIFIIPHNVYSMNNIPTFSWKNNVFNSFDGVTLCNNGGTIISDSTYSFEFNGFKSNDNIPHIPVTIYKESHTHSLDESLLLWISPKNPICLSAFPKSSGTL